MSNENVPKFLTERQAMALFPMFSKQWWQRNRWAGRGVPYRKIGRRIFYELNDLIDFFEKIPKFGSTAEDKVLKGHENA